MAKQFLDSTGLTYFINKMVYGITSPKFSTGSTYTVGDFVIYTGKLYRCTTAVTVAGAWSASKWVQTTVKGEIKALNTNLTKIVSASVFTIPITDWVSTTIDGMAYYTYVISLTAVNTDVPDVMIGAADTLPTSAEQDAYNCIKYAIVDASALTLKLYAESVPTANFYIRVKGVK